MAAAIFAVHPLRVESVAWVAERKDVLSGLFFVLTLWAYVGYARRRFSITRYLTVVALFALGLMAKPMLVTLPFVLLLLDYWPLGRVAGTPSVPSTKLKQPVEGASQSCGAFHAYRITSETTAHGMWLLLVEKVPLFLLSAASCVVTTVAQGDTVATLDVLPWRLRVANAFVSYATYVGQFFYPAGLAVFYPHLRVGLPMWKAAAALVVLVGISAAVADLLARNVRICWSAGCGFWECSCR